MQDLLYIKANSFVPEGVVSSTARRGDKWSKLLRPGDVVHLKTFESQAVFGQAAVVKVETLKYSDVIANARSNHVTWQAGVNESNAGKVLAAALEAAYNPDGNHPISADEIFTSIHIIPIRL